MCSVRRHKFNKYSRLLCAGTLRGDDAGDVCSRRVLADLLKQSLIQTKSTGKITNIKQNLFPVQVPYVVTMQGTCVRDVSSQIYSNEV